VDVKAVVLSDGTVDVYLKQAKQVNYPAKPTLSYRFKGATPGYLGARAFGVRARFDDFAVTSRAFVP
jgi:hypothetical protein